MRRNSGIWPPSKTSVGFLAPALAHWPLWPRVEVLPMPLPGPRPTRFFRVRLVTPWWTVLRSMDCSEFGVLRLARRALEGHAAQAGDFLARAQLEQPLDGRLDQVDRVGAAVGLGEDVADAAGFQHVADA